MAKVSIYGQEPSDVEGIYGQGDAQVFRIDDRGEDRDITPLKLTDVDSLLPEVRSSGRFDIDRRVSSFDADSASVQGHLDDRLRQLENLRIASEVDSAALQGQYEGLISRFRDSWRLSETQEEKDRLLYMLADIEAQYDAGQKSIEQVYGAKIASVKSQAEAAAAGNVARTGENVARLTAGADALDERLGGVSSAVAEGTRGMGVGLGQTGTNEWANLVRAQIPIQESSLFNVGQIGVDALNYLAEAGGLQQAAQQGDLSRLRAATTSAAQYGHMRDVAQRIDREHMAKREFEINMALKGVAAAAAGASENRQNAIRLAELGDRAAQYAVEQYNIQDSFAAAEGQDMRSFNDFLQGFYDRYGTTPSNEQISRFVENGHRQSYNALQQIRSIYQGLLEQDRISSYGEELQRRERQLAERHAEYQYLMSQLRR